MSAYLIFLFHMALMFCVLLRVFVRPHRDPASRVAWVAVIAAVPFMGVVAYLLFGETNIGRRRIEKTRRAIASLPPMPPILNLDNQVQPPQVPGEYQHLFDTGKSINDFDVVGGNRGRLMEDSNKTIDSMVADIDAATENVHLMFYIWLTDNNGLKMIEALKRAAGRGVKCRAMTDSIGSRNLLRSKHWKEMQTAGVDVAVALPITYPIVQMLFNRIDLRNHRKVLVIDNQITYCGSQNCADPEFLVKKKYAPWVDAMIRFEGPVVRQNQFLFASDWLASKDDNLNDILSAPIKSETAGFPAQVIGTGPTFRFSAMPEMFESLFFTARNELVISTPYFVPVSSTQHALCAAAWRGVKTKVIFPAKNDSRIVGPASRSYYEELLDAGVEIHEYQGGLLHTKSLTLDGKITLIGSANMDRRSFELNYENNILFYDQALTADVRERQEQYLNNARQVTLEEVQAWPLHTRIWNNTLATLGPIL